MRIPNIILPKNIEELLRIIANLFNHWNLKFL
jgi:hypothetical protein